MSLKITEEKMKIEVGAEVYSVSYPSFKQVQEIPDSFKDLDGKQSIDKMKEWLVNLGLDEKFFDLDIVKSKHVMSIWEEINNIKK